MRWRLFLICGWLFSLAACFAAGIKPEQDSMNGRFTGRMLTREGVPMSNGLVYFFAAEGPELEPEKYWRVPDLLVGTKENGAFSAELPAGEYFFGAIKRISGKTENGPPRVGDYFFKAVDKQGRPKRYVVKKGKTLNVGDVAEATPFKGLITAHKISAIQGTVAMSDGTPVEGALVFAFLSSEMKSKPAFASYSTGTDGAYLLRVHEGGTYYLRVRDHYGGGPPVAGEIMGVFGNPEPQAVSVMTGETVTGIDITADRFKGRGQQNRPEDAQGPPEMQE